jgi:peptidyl-prolyl cis-trans isomerase A (cyclophilin A)
MFTLSLFALVIGCTTEAPEVAPEPEPVEEVRQAPPAKAKTAVPEEPAELSPEVAALVEKLDPAKATEQAPESYKVVFETTEGDFTVAVSRADAPKGADRLFNLVKMGYYEDIAFYRAIDNFMAQFGLHGEPAVTREWRDARIEDDEVTLSNERGTLTFATAGPNTRTTQLFINFKDNTNLDAMGFSPVGRVVSGMEVVDKIFTGYGEGAPRGAGPMQPRIHREGNAYLRDEFPNLSYIKSARIE